MSFTPAKENILKKIRKALSHSTPIPFPNSEGQNSVFQPSLQEMEIEFAEQFSGLLGKFIFCLDHTELVLQLNALIHQRQWTKIYCCEENLKQIFRENSFDNYSEKDLAKCEVSITTCEALVARTGSIVLSTAQESGRTVSVYAPVHICIAYTRQLNYDIKDALQMLKEKYRKQLPSLITFATGPSRTADIEKTLVVGVHGPGEVFCFLVDQ